VEEGAWGRLALWVAWMGALLLIVAILQANGML
jgi:hypothetical protein